eukprot:m.175348 g.175348  ORF g.175348 m.175348 type:complete len:219 (+) comp16776_c1_seq1:287-943(+)
METTPSTFSAAQRPLDAAIVQPTTPKVDRAIPTSCNMTITTPPSSPAPHRNSLLARRGFSARSLSLSFEGMDQTLPSGEDLRSETWTDDNLAMLFDLGISIGSEAASSVADPTSTTVSPDCYRGRDGSSLSPLLVHSLSKDGVAHGQASSPCLLDALSPSPLDSAIGTGFDSAGFEAGCHHELPSTTTASQPTKARPTSHTMTREAPRIESSTAASPT